jgi:hypothetical protein
MVSSMNGGEEFTLSRQQNAQLGQRAHRQLRGDLLTWRRKGWQSAEFEGNWREAPPGFEPGMADLQSAPLFLHPKRRQALPTMPLPCLRSVCAKTII